MARLRLISLMLMLLTLLLYLRVWQNDFVLYDDPEYVTENLMVQKGLSWAGVKWAFSTFEMSNWHPLTWLSHMADVELFGLNPGPHHVMNVLWHIGNAILVAMVVFRLTGGLWVAAMVAGLFAWHPTRVESVAWIAERKDVLSTFFGLLATMGYLRWTGRNSDAGQRRTTAYWVCLGCFGLSLLAKPMLVTLPFVFLLLDYWPLQRLGRGSALPACAQPFHARALLRRAVEKWPFFLLTIGSCVVTYLAQRSVAVVDFEQRPLSIRLLNAVVAYARYLGKLFWPTDLAVIYPLEDRLPWDTVALAAIALVGISWLAWRWRLVRPWFLVGWLWFIGTLVPVIGIIQVGGQSMADRYTYFPFVGLFIVITLFGRESAQIWAGSARRQRGPAAVPGVLASTALLAFACVTWRQLGYWKDSRTLFARAVAVTKENDIAHTNLGVALEEESRFEEALFHYREALRLRPNRVQVYNNIGNVLAASGKKEEALGYYLEALRRMPDAPLAHMNLGSLLLDMDRFDDAMQHFHAAARAAPNDPRPHFFMGKAWLRRGKKIDGIAHLREALRRSPNDIQALLILSRLFAADEDATIRNGPEAVALAEHANHLTGGENAVVLDTLAMAYAEAGRFDEAERAIQKAIATAGQAKEEVSVLQARLALYRAGRPYRESTEPSKPN